MKLIGIDCDSSEQQPAKVERWYDQRSRNWIVQLLDENGNQIGDAFYCYTKKEACDEEKRLKEKYNL